jgi:hypothetical protein
MAYSLSADRLASELKNKILTHEKIQIHNKWQCL